MKRAKKRGPKTKPKPGSPTPLQLHDVLRALMHSKTTAIVFEHLAEYTADAFRGNDARGPKKLLAMPNGTKCRASVEDVLSVERALQQLAADARRRVSELERAEVLVERAAVLPEEVSSTSTPPAPPGEGVVDAVAARPPTPSGSAPRRT